MNIIYLVLLLVTTVLQASEWKTKQQLIADSMIRTGCDGATRNESTMLLSDWHGSEPGVPHISIGMDNKKAIDLINNYITTLNGSKILDGEYFAEQRNAVRKRRKFIGDIKSIENNNPWKNVGKTCLWSTVPLIAVACFCQYAKYNADAGLIKDIMAVVGLSAPSVYSLWRALLHGYIGYLQIKNPDKSFIEKKSLQAKEDYLKQLEKRFDLLINLTHNPNSHNKFEGIPLYKTDGIFYPSAIPKIDGIGLKRAFNLT